ncbi:proteasome activator complex subunit 3-like [Sphaerodactylus townsendi]|uniref:proteasome activator complex subunit 3-like n=1 Tax=Sphaerodactylus townsendi TaxID=933632 RepID=UPI002025C062|nr:proteasome activator complex subunit 3-like [Sphaerodactylus townsendi]
MSPPPLATRSGCRTRGTERDRLGHGPQPVRPAMAAPKVDSEMKHEIDKFRDTIAGEAEDLVANFFPKKLLELDAFLKDPLWNNHSLTQIHSGVNVPVPDARQLTSSRDKLAEPNTKKRKLEECEEALQGTKLFAVPNRMLKSNRQLVDLIEKVEPEIRLMVEKCSMATLWVELLIPKIEDGNNFGVSIQEETVSELQTVMNEATTGLEEICNFYTGRAKLVSKIAKYPYVEDYRRTVTEMDEKEFISLRFILSSLRNQYVTLHDMILKNVEKIKRPRSSNAETLY